MKTLAELKEMSFIPHHTCSLCGSIVGWVVSKDALKPYFDPSCDCVGSEGHYDTWEDVFKWYNTVDEKETEEAVQAAWNKEATKGCVGFIHQRLEHVERELFSFANCKPVCEMLENHKSNWIPNSKSGEPNCRRG